MCKQSVLSKILQSLSNFTSCFICKAIGDSPDMAHATESTAPADSVGPDYRPKTEKPTATISTQISYDNVHILPQTPQLIALLT